MREGEPSESRSSSPWIVDPALEAFLERYPALHAILRQEVGPLVMHLERKLRVPLFPLTNEHRQEIALVVIEDFIAAIRTEPGFADYPYEEQCRHARRFVSRAFHQVYRKEAARRLRFRAFGEKEGGSLRAPAASSFLDPREVNPAVSAILAEAQRKCEELWTKEERRVLDAALDPWNRTRSGRVNTSRIGLALKMNRRRVRRLYLSALEKALDALEHRGTKRRPS